jgi:hypothetical protein
MRAELAGAFAVRVDVFHWDEQRNASLQRLAGEDYGAFTYG